MRVGVLGPLEVTTSGGVPVDVGGRQPRVLLAALVAANGRPLSAGALIEAVWGDRPPASATGSLQSYVSRLRRALDDGGPPLLYDDAGYRLDLSGHTVDVVRFEELAAEGHSQLQTGAPAAARETFADALALWRGPALVELVDQGVALAQAAALEERRLAVLEERIDADLALGRHRHLVGELQQLASDHPLREGLYARLALALYRSDRQADALRVLADARTLLREELGLDPGRSLRDLEAAILAHDAALDPPVLATPEAAAPAAGGQAVPFVGRDADLAALLACYAEAPADARFVVLEGDAGIGKTRLADELAARVVGHGSLAVWGRSNECGAAPALWPWLPVLRAVLGIVPDAPAVLASEAPLLPGQGGAVQFERFDAIAAVLEQAGTTAPLVILLDDLQWCDPASLELLQFLATRAQRGVLLIATVRTLEVGRHDEVTDALGAIARRSGSKRIQLRGLSATATGELLDALAPDRTTPEISARIHERAEGNPFYAIELARILNEAEGIDGEVPVTVRDAIRRHLYLLPEATIDVLAVAATTGRDVDIPLVASAADLDVGECLDLLEPAATHRLLVESSSPGVLRFSHALVRETLIDGLTPLRRARLHLQVADAIEQSGVGRDDLEVLAEHLWRAVALGVGQRAADALEQAADVAISRVAYVVAEDLLTRAVELRRAAGSSPAAQQAELDALLRLLEVMQATRYFAGTDRDALHRAQDLAAQLGHDDVHRTLKWSEWAALSTAARVAEAQPMAEQYLARWEQDPRPQVRASAHTLFGVDEWTRGRIRSAMQHLDEAAALLADAPPPEDAFEGGQRVIANCFGLYCHAAHGGQTPEEAFAGFDFMLGIVPPPAVAAVCYFGAAVAAVHTRWDAVDRLVRHALELDPASQFAFFGGQLLMLRGLVDAHRGDYDAGLASFVEGRSRLRAVGGRSGTPTYQALLAELLAQAGRLNDAAELAAGARLQTDESGEGWNEVTICIAEGVVAEASGHRDRARERLTTAVATGKEQGADALADRAAAILARLPADPPRR